jgi:hypothetical protein
MWTWTWTNGRTIAASRQDEPLTSALRRAYGTPGAVAGELAGPPIGCHGPTTVRRPPGRRAGQFRMVLGRSETFPRSPPPIHCAPKMRCPGIARPLFTESSR